MNLVGLSIRQPVTIVVGVLLFVLAGLVAFDRIPVQLAPNVEDTVIAVTTRWEGASPEEVELEIVDEQEEKLQGLANLRRITSVSRQGQGQIRLEFTVGTDKDAALREVSDKLREVPDYPANVDEPVVEASDPENRDYIAWIIFDCADDSVDVRTMQDFAEDRIQPILERVPGVSEVNVLGGREREVQVRFDAAALARRGITVADLADALRRTNLDLSAGELREAKRDVRVRFTSQFAAVSEVESTVVTETQSGPVRVIDVADVVETYKEPISFVRSRGRPVIAINAQKEVGANVMEVMAGLRAEIDRLNEEGGVLATEARERRLDGELMLRQVYDQTIYIEDALRLVRDNIWLGGGIATLVLLLFLRSIRSVGVVALAIPISMLGAIVVMVAMGRTINVISLAGMAFAVGMVVDNAIVVLENVFRHLEMGKRPRDAAYDGAREVAGAVVAATLTTIVVFIPILLIEEEAGQLFRDISLAIVAAVGLSLLVSLTVIPSASSRWMRARKRTKGSPEAATASRYAADVGHSRVADAIAGAVHRLSGSTLARVLVVAVFTVLSIAGTVWLMPPADYLPQGNRNLVFGLMNPPPGYSMEQQEKLARRVEATVRPWWEAGRHEPGTEAYEEAVEALPTVPTFDLATGQPGPPVTPAPIANYFLVSFEGTMFHGAISHDPLRVVDHLDLFQHATRPEVLPGVFAFAFQLPLFRLGGRTGAAVEIEFTGDDLDRVTRAASAVRVDLFERFGPYAVQAQPANFDLPLPELRVEPDLERVAEAGLEPADLGLAVQALGDGAIVGDYRVGGETIDLKLLSRASAAGGGLAGLADAPIATRAGRSMPLSSFARVVRVNAPQEIDRSGRRRAITLQLTPPAGTPLESAVEAIDVILSERRADGTIPASVGTSYSGSASKLEAVQRAMLGDGTPIGTLTSSAVLALSVVFLLLAVLFQSFLRPLVILLSVPLATLGGFVALSIVHAWTANDPYLPTQNLDVLTMLGFVILTGIVVNNAILIVHQTLHFLNEGELDRRRAIAEAVRTRVRPIFMSTTTSVGGMLPLVLMPGSGSELYRGLGSVVIGGLVVSTVFTLLLVPLLLSLVLDLQAFVERRRRDESTEAAAGRRRVGAPAAGLVALLALGQVSCAASREADRPARALEAIEARELEALGAPDGPEIELVAPGSSVPEAVAARREELEARGGPESWRAAEPDLGRDLAGEERRTLPIGLREAVASAVAHNLGLRRMRIEPAIARTDVEVARSAFDVVFFADAELERVDVPQAQPVINGIAVGTSESERLREEARAGVSKLFSSGATVEVSSFVRRLDDRTSGIAFEPDPSWRSGLGFSVVQPLLRGFGPTVNESAIELGRLRAGAAERDLEAEVLALVALVTQSFHDLAQAWEEFHVLERLTREGEAVERVLGERLEFDTDPAEYADALATVEQRRADRLRARHRVSVASDRLRELLDDSAYPIGAQELFVPLEQPPEEPLAFRLRDAVELALERRPEVEAAALGIDDARLRERVAEDALDPRLDLVAGVEVAGLDDDFGPSAGDLFEEDFQTFLLGLSFELPVGNRRARAERRRARLEASDSFLRYEEVVQSVVAEVKSALREAEQAWSLLAAARAFRLAQTENLRALEAEEATRSQLTPEFLALKFQRQERLAEAQLEEVRARADYARAIAMYERAIGAGLGAHRVRVVEGEEGEAGAGDL